MFRFDCCWPLFWAERLPFVLRRGRSANKKIQQEARKTTYEWKNIWTEEQLCTARGDAHVPRPTGYMVLAIDWHGTSWRLLSGSWQPHQRVGPPGSVLPQPWPSWSKYTTESCVGETREESADAVGGSGHGDDRGRRSMHWVESDDAASITQLVRGHAARHA